MKLINNSKLINKIIANKLIKNLFSFILLISNLLALSAIVLKSL